MVCGFRFRGRHCSEFGIVAKTKSSVLIPQVKKYAYSPALYDGEMDFSDANPYGRVFYENRTVELQLQFGAECLAELSKKAAKIASWLCGSGYLEFDNANSSRWFGRVASQTDFVPELEGRKAIIGVIFTISAMGESDFEVGGELSVSSGIMLGAGIPLDMNSKFQNIPLSSGNNILKFFNIGDFYVRPIFEFGKEVDMISVSFSGKSITVNSIGQNGLFVDFEKHIARDGDGNNIMNKMSGEFFEFPAGVSEYAVYCDKGTEMNIRYMPKCVYDFDFSELEWEEENA